MKKDESHQLTQDDLEGQRQTGWRNRYNRHRGPEKDRHPDENRFPMNPPWIGIGIVPHVEEQEEILEVRT